MKYTLLLLIFLMSLANTTAQSSIRGTIINADSGEPVPYVSVFLSRDHSAGVLSNEYGEYELRITSANRPETVVFSSLGYETEEITVSEPADSVSNVKLRGSILELDEIVVISDLGLRKIVEECLATVSDNYGSRKHLLETYFRRYTVSDGNTSHIKEAFLTIEDDAYPSEDKYTKYSMRMWLNHYRESDDYRSIRFLDDMKDHNGLFSQYRWFNLMRGKTIAWLGDFDPKAYTFSNRGTYLMGQDSVMRISYELENPREKAGDISTYLYDGELLVNLTDLAIIRNTLGQGREDFKFDVIYRKQAGRYYPHRMHLVIALGYQNGTASHTINSLLYCYNVVTGKEEKKRVPKGKRLLSTVPVSASSIKYDTEFWDNNKILIKIPLEEGILLDRKRLDDLDAQYRRNSKGGG